MSSADVRAEEASASGQNIATPIPSPRRVGPWSWSWTVIACVLLGASGVVRAVQDRRHRDERNYVEACPIPLASIPKKLGVWHLVEDGEKKLDDQTMRITGGSDYIMRAYADDLTGVTVMVLLLYGPAEPVLPHTPEVCYPSSGYSSADESSDAMIKFSLGKNAEGRPVEGEAQFRNAIYQKATNRMKARQAVYHSFRLDGQWSPYIGAGRKFPRRNPGIFKIQVQRGVIEGEKLSQGDPIEQFLSSLLAELEKEIKEASEKKATPKSS